MYEQLKEWRKEIVSWIAVGVMIIGGLEGYFLPKVEHISKNAARAESNRVLYLYYSELTASYVAIPDPKPHQKARLEEVRSQRDKFRAFMQTDYEADRVGE